MYLNSIVKIGKGERGTGNEKVFSLLNPHLLPILTSRQALGLKILVKSQNYIPIPHSHQPKRRRSKGLIATNTRAAKPNKIKIAPPKVMEIQGVSITTLAKDQSLYK